MSLYAKEMKTPIRDFSRTSSGGASFDGEVGLVNERSPGAWPNDFCFSSCGATLWESD